MTAANDKVAAKVTAILPKSQPFKRAATPWGQAYAAVMDTSAWPLCQVCQAKTDPKTVTIHPPRGRVLLSDGKLVCPGCFKRGTVKADPRFVTAAKRAAKTAAKPKTAAK